MVNFIVAEVIGSFQQGEEYPSVKCSDSLCLSSSLFFTHSAFRHFDK